MQSYKNFIIAKTVISSKAFTIIPLKDLKLAIEYY
jgi:hypothetical protein